MEALRCVIVAGTPAERKELALYMEKGIETPGITEDGNHWVFRSTAEILVCALGAALVGKHGPEEAVRVESEASAGGKRIPNRGIRECLGIPYDLFAQVDSWHQHGSSTREIVAALRVV